MNERILIIDDNRDIHADIERILSGKRGNAELDDLESLVFGDDLTAPSLAPHTFRLDSAYQGQEGFEMVKAAVAEGAPYAMAVVDMRMPPGWDGLETIERILEVDSEIQLLVCSAYSDRSWSEIAARVGDHDLLILKKPFESIEIMQMVHNLTRRWRRARSDHRAST